MSVQAVDPRPGRNDPCTCGSGIKYKKCCGIREPNGVAAAAPLDFAALAALLNAGRAAELESRVRALLEREPGSGRAWKFLGAALWMQGKDGVPALEKAARLLPRDAEAQTNLGNALSAAGRLEEAAVCHRRALEIQPDYAEAHNNLGSVLRDLERLDEAAAAFRRALVRKPNFALAHNNLGVVLLRLGRTEEAVHSYRRAIVGDSRFALAHANLGDALQRLGHFEEAGAAYRRAVDLDPGFTEVHAKLGSLDLEMGRFEQAVAWCKKTLAARPRDAETLSNLGSALRSLGQAADAAARYGQALELLPDNAEIHNNLGNALFDLGRPAEAAQSYARAVELKPDYAKAHSNLGSAFRELGLLEEAEACHHRALALDSENAELHVNLALVQRLLGRLADADGNARRALELDPRSSAATTFLGDLRADRGQFAEAEGLYRRSIDIDPNASQAWAGLAGLRKFTSDDDAWLDGARRLAGTPLPPRDEVNLRYALGKYFDDLQQYDAAFEQYLRANELTKSYRPPHDRARITDSFEVVAGRYDRDWIDASRSSELSQRPVFVVGTPRSGTSLAEQILASHPGVFGAGELAFWTTTARRLGAEGRDAGAPGEPPAALARDYLQVLESLSADASRVVDKMPHNFAHLGLIHAALPNARIIHMRRNPLDACLSIYFHNFHIAHSYANDLDDLVHFYGQYQRIMAHWHAVLPAGTILDVPYEGLIADQEKWSRAMVDFVGLPWDPACLEFHRTARSVSTFSKWQVRQKITATSVERWRNYAAHIGPLTNLLTPAGSP